jgi:hypothetical protein
MDEVLISKKELKRVAIIAEHAVDSRSGIYSKVDMLAVASALYRSGIPLRHGPIMDAWNEHQARELECED